MNGPVNDRYRRRFRDPRQWPSNVVFGLYAEVKTEVAVNELSWEWAGNEVADEAARFLAVEEARKRRRRTAQAEGWRQGQPGE